MAKLMGKAGGNTLDATYGQKLFEALPEGTPKGSNGISSVLPYTLGDIYNASGEEG